MMTNKNRSAHPRHNDQTMKSRGPMKPMMVLTVFLFMLAALGGEAWPRSSASFDAAKEGHTNSSHIFVDSHAGSDGDGSATAPCQTITKALQRAREIRAEKRSRIVIRVAPGEYIENFPIYLNVSNLELRGGTHLIEDDDDLPGNCGTDSAPEPCVKPGTETLITPTVPIQLGQYLFTVSPTKDSSADRLTDIAISGFVFDGKATAVGSSGSAILVDRVGNFSIHHNVARRVRIGIATRMSSGRIRKNFFYNDNAGIAVSGGSEVYPAQIQISSNRALNNLEVGAAAVGAAFVRTRGLTDPNIEIPTLFDPAQHPEQVPDKLVLEVIGNDFSRIPRFGFRFEIYSDDTFYNTTDNQPMTANITATLRGNAFRSNREYGVVVDAFIPRTNPRRFISVLTGAFENNDFSGSGRAGIFAGFGLNGMVTRNPGLINSYTYHHDSRFTMELDEETGSFGVNYDNPVLDPFDKVTPLNNRLTINGATFAGRHVTCPPGFPCVP